MPGFQSFLSFWSSCHKDLLGINSDKVNMGSFYGCNICYRPRTKMVQEFEFEFCFSPHLCQLWLIRD